MKTKGYAVQSTEKEIDHQDQQKIHQRRNIPGENKQILGNVDFGEDSGIAEQTAHAAFCGFLEIGHNQVAAEQVGGIKRGVAAEKLGKNHLHYQKRQQWGQDAPGHTQNSPLVFLLEITLDQFFKKKLVFF